MRLIRKRGSHRNPLKKIISNSRGQITLELVWKVLAIIGLVIAAIILFNVRGYLSNYLAKAYDCLRFGGCW